MKEKKLPISLNIQLFAEDPDPEKGGVGDEPDKRHPKKGNPKTNSRIEASLTYGKATAVNGYMAGPGFVAQSTSGEETEYIEQFPYGNNVYYWYPEEAADNWQYTNQSLIKTVIEKVAAEYFTTVDPSTVQDIYNNLITVQTHSIRIYGMVCSLFRMQSSRNIKDELNRDLGILFNPAPTSSLSTPLTADVELQLGNWNISNADWANKYLQKLDYARLSPVMKAQMEFLLVNTFKLSRSDATQRYATLYCALSIQGSESATGLPENLYGNETAIQNRLNESVTAIQNAMSNYPLLDTICEQLGWEIGSKFNFTRDLKGSTLYVWDDKYSDIEYMLYCTGQVIPDAFEEAGLTSLDGIISKQGQSVHFLSNVLRIDDRVLFDVTSLTNFIRGGSNIYRCLVFFQTNQPVAGSTATPSQHVIDIFPIGFIPRNLPTSVPASVINNYMVAAMYQEMTDPIGTPYMVEIDFATPTAPTFYAIQPVLAVDDYVMNVADIALVRSESSFNIMFGNAKNINVINKLTYTINSVDAGNYTKK